MPSATEPRESPVAAGSGVLRLLAAEPSGAILTQLADGSLRSSRLMERLSAYSPRTVYRRLGELEQQGAIARRKLAITPPAVAYELTRPGAELLRMVDGPVSGWLRYRRATATEVQATASLALLAESWETAIFHELGCDERSLTELGEILALTHHQTGRRVKRLAAAGILIRRTGEDRIARYSLSETARLGAAVIAAAAAWEADLAMERSTTLDLGDAVALLAGTLSLPRLPDHPGQVLGLTVSQESENGDGARFASLWAAVEAGGTVHCGLGPAPEPDGWAQGSVAAWLGVVLDGKRGGLQVGGDTALVDTHLTCLHTRLRKVG